VTTPAAAQPRSVSVDASLLKIALKSALLVCSKDDSRPALNSVLFESSELSLGLVATDGHRIVELKARATGDAGIRCQLSRDDVVRCLRVCTLGRDKTARVELKQCADGRILFGLPDCKVKLKPVTKEFPPYNKAFPARADKTTGPCEATGCNAAYLLDLATIAKLVSERNEIRIQPTDESLGPLRFDVTGHGGDITATYALMPLWIVDHKPSKRAEQS
jgi:DNA polymerase III sliding clamp (beta) subunit (PCNA family)